MGSFVRLTLSYKPFLVIGILFLLAKSSAKAAIRYVKPIASGTSIGSSWPNACSDLQLMINNGVCAVVICIAKSTYKPGRKADALAVSPYSGTGNIATNSLFINPVCTLLPPAMACVYRLQKFSPAINVGYIPGIPPGITIGIIGNPRIFPGKVYEM